MRPVCLEYGIIGSTLGNTVIKGRGKYYDIAAHFNAMEECELDPTAIVRLYCLSRNDCNNMANWATAERMIVT